MARRSMENALTSSLRAEQQAVDDRFSRLSKRAVKADEVLDDQAESHPQSIERSQVSLTPRLKDPYDVQNTPTGEEKFDNPIEKVVRANFSMPVADYDLIAQIRDRCSRNGLILSRSEILRTGLYALKSLSMPQLLEVTQSIERLKPGRVKRDKKKQ